MTTLTTSRIQRATVDLIGLLKAQAARSLRMQAQLVVAPKVMLEHPPS